MGLHHRDQVWALPEGYVTDAQRLLLLALAENTNDERMQWGHGHQKLRDMLGGWSETKLNKNLKELEDADLITRRRQRRRKDGSGEWENQVIYLGGLYLPTDRATVSAAGISGRQHQLKRGRTDPVPRLRRVKDVS